jgi:hypothetical protein
VNRDERRDTQRFLRRGGCRCTIRFEPTPGRDDPTVVHHLGCPLGDVLLKFNRVGILPTIIYTGPPRCTR